MRFLTLLFLTFFFTTLTPVHAEDSQWPLKGAAPSGLPEKGHPAYEASQNKAAKKMTKEERHARMKEGREKWNALSPEEKAKRKAERKAMCDALPADKKAAMKKKCGMHKNKKGKMMKKDGHKKGAKADGYHIPQPVSRR